MSLHLADNRGTAAICSLLDKQTLADLRAQISHQVESADARLYKQELTPRTIFEQQIVKDLFDQILQEGAEGVNRLITQRQQENVELEFKTKSNQNNGELTKEDRKNLGTILSAFANSMGGLVIWGVLAAKNSDGIDCATESKPILEIEKFKSEVERALSQAIMPRHEDIRVAVVTEQDGAGYLLIQVERSERRPHRCEFGEKQYFKRIGDSSIAMEHYDIEDSFKRITVPKLSAEIELRDGGTTSSKDGAYKTLTIAIWLKNDSLVTARYPYFLMDGANVDRAPFSQKPENYTGGADQVIHPGLSLEVIQLHHRVLLDNTGSAQRFQISSITINFRFGCYNASPTKDIFFLSPEQIMDALRL
jgi:hypothetical protein